MKRHLEINGTYQAISKSGHELAGFEYLRALLHPLCGVLYFTRKWLKLISTQPSYRKAKNVKSRTDRDRKIRVTWIIEIIIPRIFQHDIYMYEYLCDQGSAGHLKGLASQGQIVVLTSRHSLLPMPWVYSTHTVKMKREICYTMV